MTSQFPHHAQSAAGADHRSSPHRAGAETPRSPSPRTGTAENERPGEPGWTPRAIDQADGAA